MSDTCAICGREKPDEELMEVTDGAGERKECKRIRECRKYVGGLK